MLQNDFLTEGDLKEIKKDVVMYRNLLNYTIGLYALTAGISCLTSPSPFTIATAYLVGFVLLNYMALKSFSPTLTAARELAKESEDERFNTEVRAIERLYCRPVNVVRDNPVYMVGSCFLFLIWLLAGRYPTAITEFQRFIDMTLR